MPNDVNLGAGRRLHIKAAELDHLSGVQTFGYTVEEQPPPGNIDVEKAKALGVMPGKKYSFLKCGIPVPTDDGTEEVHPDQVLIQSFRPRKFAFLADHRRVPTQMAQLCTNADLLIHEATLSKKDGLDVSNSLIRLLTHFHRAKWFTQCSQNSFLVVMSSENENARP